MNAFPDIPVFIRNLAGEYLSREEEGSTFTRNRSGARVFQYHADAVAIQLEQAQRELGTIWVAFPVDPSLVSEKCDACGCVLSTTDAHFDDSRYLCPDCHHL